MISMAPIIPGRDNGRVIFQKVSSLDNPKSLAASIREKSILSNETYKGSKANAAHAWVRVIITAVSEYIKKVRGSLSSPALIKEELITPLVPSIIFQEKTLKR